MINKTSRILGIIVLILGLLVLSLRTQAQNVVRKGNEFVQVSVSDSVKKTQYTYKSKDGVVYPIFLSPKGKAFIVCTSKKTGKQYRRYLPNVTKELKKS